MPRALHRFTILSIVTARFSAIVQYLFLYKYDSTIYFIDLPEKVNDLRMLRAKTEKSFLLYSRNSLIRKGAPVIVMRIVRK